MLVDTDILVDCLRAALPAVHWLSTATDEFEIPGVVAMELVAGCLNQGDLRRIRRFLEQFTIAWPTSEEFADDFGLLIQHRLKDGLGLSDALIGAMALRRQAQLYSFNLKHFRVIKGLRVTAPYVRT